MFFEWEYVIGLSMKSTINTSMYIYIYIGSFLVAVDTAGSFIQSPVGLVASAVA